MLVPVLSAGDEAVKRISDKRAAQLAEYHKVLTQIGGGWQKTSDLSGKWPGVPHHIYGRRGELLYDPFNIIYLTPEEHTDGQDAVHKHNTPELKAKLAGIVKEIRERQGWAIKDLEEAE